MAGFPLVIPEDEKNAVGARRFGEHAALEIAKLAPARLPVDPLPDEGPYPGALPVGGFDPNAGFSLPPEPAGGFMPEPPPQTGGFLPAPPPDAGVFLPEAPGPLAAGGPPAFDPDQAARDASMLKAYTDGEIAKLTTYQGPAGAVPEEQSLEEQAPDAPPFPPFARLNLPGLPGAALPIGALPGKPVQSSEETARKISQGRLAAEDVLGKGAGTLTRMATGAEAFDPLEAGVSLFDTGEVGRFVGQQGGQTQPASVLDTVIPEERAGQIVRRAEARGGFGGVGGFARAAGGGVQGGDAGDLLAGWRKARDQFELIRERTPEGETFTLRHGPTGHEVEGFASVEDAQRFGARLAGGDLSTSETFAAAAARAAAQFAEEVPGGVRPGRAVHPAPGSAAAGPEPLALEPPGGALPGAGGLGRAADPAALGPPPPAGRVGADRGPAQAAAEAAQPAEGQGRALAPASVDATVRALEDAITRGHDTAAVPLPRRLEQARRAFVRLTTDRAVDLNAYQQEAQKALGRPLNADELAAELARLNPDRAAEVALQENLRPVLRDVGADRGKLSVWLRLQDTVDAGKAGADGVAPAEARRSLDALAAELGPERARRVQDAAERARAFAARLEQRRTQAGLPARTPGEPLVLRDAAEAKPGDPLAWLVAQAYQVEADARRNETFGALARLADALPDGDVRRVTAGHRPPAGGDRVVVAGHVAGAPARLAMPREIAAALEQAKQGGLPVLSQAMAVFRAALTSRNPAFLASNSVLDALNYTGRTLSREGGNPLRAPGVALDLARAYVDAFRGLLDGTYHGDTARFLRQGGGQFGFFGGEQGARTAVRDLSRAHALEVRSASDALGIVRDLLLLKPVESIGERIELAPRVAAMRRAEKAGANPVQATIAGRSVTLDFAQGGTAAKVINQFVPFFNAATQGAAAPARALRENPRGFLGTVATMLVAPVVAAEAWNRSDPQRAQDYDDVPADVKNQGVVVMLPGEAPVDGRGERRPQFVLIRTREWTPGVALVREIAGRQMGANPSGWLELLGTAGAALSPVQGQSAEDVLGNLMPPPLGTAAQLAADRNTFFGSPIATKTADANASPLSRGLAAGLNAIGVEARPSQIEFGIRDYLGAYGQIASEGSKLALGEEKRTGLPQDVPVAGAFVRRFVRGDVGGNLERAQESRLTDEARAVLDGAGMGDFTPAPVSYRIGDRTLTREQQARVQVLTNAAVDATLKALASSDGWEDAPPAVREKAVRAAITRARAYARAEAVAAFGGDLAPAPTATPRPSTPRAPTPTRTDVDPERSAGARRAAQTRARNATATAEARR